MIKYPIKTSVRNGVPVRIKECATCHAVKLVADDSSSEFPINTRRTDGSVSSWQPHCKPCYARRVAERRLRFIDRARAHSREQHRRIMADPERLAARRARDAAYRRKARKDPVRNARIKATQKAWRERKKKADPTYFAEMDRIQHRLERERKGVAVTRSFRNVLGLAADPIPSLPAAPLVRMINGLAEAHGQFVGDICSLLGVSDRRYRDWRNGVYNVSFAAADKVLTNADLLFADVWPADEYPQIAERLGYAERTAA